MKTGIYQLPTGREVFLCRLHVERTYSGVLEGGPKTASPHLLKRVPEAAREMMPPGTPLVVVPPLKMPLPQFRLLAKLESERGVQTTDADYNSRLFVCWFVEELDQTIHDLLAAVLAAVDWEANAEDYDITNC